MREGLVSLNFSNNSLGLSILLIYVAFLQKIVYTYIVS